MCSYFCCWYGCILGSGIHLGDSLDNAFLFWINASFNQSFTNCFHTVKVLRKLIHWTLDIVLILEITHKNLRYLFILFTCQKMSAISCSMQLKYVTALQTTFSCSFLYYHSTNSQFKWWLLNRRERERERERYLFFFVCTHDATGCQDWKGELCRLGLNYIKNVWETFLVHIEECLILI